MLLPGCCLFFALFIDRRMWGKCVEKNTVVPCLVNKRTETTYIVHKYMHTSKLYIQTHPPPPTHTFLAKDIKRGGTNNFNYFHIFKRHFYRCSQDETEICLCISKYFSSQCHRDVFWAFKLLKWKIGLLIPSACSVRIFVRGQVRDRERERERLPISWGWKQMFHEWRRNDADIYVINAALWVSKVTLSMASRWRKRHGDDKVEWCSPS